MADNLVIVGKIGTTGAVFTIVLKETNASGVLVPKDITGYTALKMQVEKSDGTVIMNEVACVIASAAAGQITCTTDLTVAAHAGLVVGEHKLEFSGLNAAGKKRYWPMNAQSERTFGKFIVQSPLA